MGGSAAAAATIQIYLGALLHLTLHRFARLILTLWLAHTSANKPAPAAPHYLLPRRLGLAFTLKDTSLVAGALRFGLFGLSNDMLLKMPKSLLPIALPPYRRSGFTPTALINPLSTILTGSQISTQQINNTINIILILKQKPPEPA